MHGIYAHSRFDDLDLNARVGKAKLMYDIFRQRIEQGIRIKLDTTVGHFYATLTLQSFIWLDHIVLSLFYFVFPWGIWVAFPEESQLRQSRDTQP